MIYLANNGQVTTYFGFIKAIPYGDKVAHILLYGTLAFLLNIAMRFKSIVLLRLNIQLGATLVLAFALIEEFSQYFVSSRTLDAIDVIADIVGIVLFSYLSLLYKHWFELKKA